VVHAPSTFTGRPQFNGGGGIHVRGPFGGRGVGVGVVVPSYGFGYPGFGYYDPFLYAGPYAPTYPSYGEQYPASNYLSVQQGPSYESNQVNELTSEVQELRDEIYSLRQSFPQVYNAPPFEQPAASSRVALPTILVFRDGHQVEAQGYAVVGQSIWVLTEQTSSRMLLSDLDVEATQRLNAARGVRFLLPRTN
jgi:hypothetical protein